MAAAGVCHSDLHVRDGEWEREGPIVLGHEGSAVVEALGEGVAEASSRPAPGALVALAWLIPCGRCRALPRRPGLELLGEPSYTHRMPSGRAALRDAGRAGRPHVLRDRDVRRPPERAGRGRDPDRPTARRPEVAALIGCCVTTGVGAATKTADVQPGSSVAVIGLGGVGLSCVMGAAIAGRRADRRRRPRRGEAGARPVPRSDGRRRGRPGRRRDRRGDPRPDRRRPGHLLRGDRPRRDDRGGDRLPADRRDGLPGRDDAVRRPRVVRAVSVRRRRATDRRLELRLGRSGGRLPALRRAPPRRAAPGGPAGRPAGSGSTAWRTRSPRCAGARACARWSGSTEARSAVGGRWRRPGWAAARASGGSGSAIGGRSGVTGDQPRAAAVGQEAPGPADGHHDAIGEADQVHDVDRQPEGPGEEAALPAERPEPRDVGDAGQPADDRDVALVRVAERLASPRPTAAGGSSARRAGRPGSRPGRRPGTGRSVLPRQHRRIADREDLRVARDRQVRPDDDPAVAVGRGVRRLRDRLDERRDEDAGRPQRRSGPGSLGRRRRPSRPSPSGSSSVDDPRPGPDGRRRAARAGAGPTPSDPADRSAGSGPSPRRGGSGRRRCRSSGSRDGACRGRSRRGRRPARRPVGPPPTRTNVSHSRAVAGSCSRSAASKAIRIRRRISSASSSDLRPGASVAQSSWPKYEKRAPVATIRLS